MANSYTVPEKEGGVEGWKDGGMEQDEKIDLQSIDELPKFLRRGIFLTARNYKKIYVLFTILSQLGTTLIALTYITSSIVIGVTLTVYYSIGNSIMVLQPDFTKGVFLDLLLKDAKLTKKIKSLLKVSF